MKRMRSFYEADIDQKVNVPTTYKTEQNRNEILCSMCGQDVFVSDLIFREVSKDIEKTGENSFLCEECVWESEEEAYQH